ncbi:hypothetical protein E2562_034640 [Oryza meyeriana var. granulata]|uniref:Uncharacterized protein n=1 Tax=Oryza meyeriana var. granulata TaxID=110450 RepID=A0A6G1F1C7_9ORYZ|nr:hypothetical protein E2562_034640 [Oryza meyeriana var. granulata]
MGSFYLYLSRDLRKRSNPRRKGGQEREEDYLEGGDGVSCMLDGVGGGASPVATPRRKSAPSPVARRGRRHEEEGGRRRKLAQAASLRAQPRNETALPDLARWRKRQRWPSRNEEATRRGGHRVRRWLR